MNEKALLPIRLGIDVGSTTVKVAVLDDDDKLIYGDYQRHRADIRSTIIAVVNKALDFLVENVEGGEYKQAVGILYAVSYTLKMSKMGDHRIDGYFDYVVPPLEGLWWQENTDSPFDGMDYSDKDSLCWISLIRLPDFVSQTDFDWAVAEASKKKGLDCSKAEFLKITEGE